MKTKFTIKSVLILPVLIGLVYGMIRIFPSIFSDPYYDDQLFPKIFLPGILIFSFIVLFFGEIRTKYISVEIKKDEIIEKRFFGLQTKSYLFSEIEGWKYSHLSSKGGTYEYLYLYKDNHKIIKISQFYHLNYTDVKNYIESKFKYLGYEKFSYLDELKETFR